MKKSNGNSFQKTLAFAATLAALGSSLGVPSLALGMQLIETPPTEKGAGTADPNGGVIQNNRKKRTDTGATQMKEKNLRQRNQDKGIGANQIKLDRLKGTKQGNAGESAGNQLPAGQLPAVQK